MYTTTASEIMLKMWYVLGSISLKGVCVNEVVLYFGVLEV